MIKTASHWEKVGFYPHHGLLVPLFSLKTQKSSGIGEFLDMIPLIDWCAAIHFDVIQLLPLNDTGEDLSPYNPISSCALDPVYLSLADLPDGKGLGLHEFGSLNDLPRLARGEVKQRKLEWLFRYFEKVFGKVYPTKEYQKFLQEHPWLSDYVRFKVSCEKSKGEDFERFLQFLSFSQMEEVRSHATRRKVFLNGDIPILLNPESVDVAAHPEFFHRDLAAGAPPDFYNRLGQKWGFPLYNWKSLREANFAWWKQRLQVAERCFHIYRIDHVVGLFRMWGIPAGALPSEGKFFPEDVSLWWGQGREILEMMIDSTSMLPMAEDLGTVPREVEHILKELGICGVKVLNRQRRWATNRDYLPFSEYELLSLATAATHDMNPLQLWWKKYPDEAAPYAKMKKWVYQPKLLPEQRYAILKDLHSASSFFHVNLLSEYLALFPELIWPRGEEERINLPGTHLPTNWTMRLRSTVEEIAAHKGLGQSMREFANRSSLDSENLREHPLRD